MGIDVSKNLEVTVDHSHNNRVFTGLHRNPVRGSLGTLPVVSVFRRNKIGDHERDGSPLIYAMKRINGYYIGARSISALYDPFINLLSSILQTTVPTVLVPIPSSSRINSILCKRIQRMLGGQLGICDCLDKNTKGHVLGRMPEINAVPDNIKSDFRRTLNSLQKGSPNDPVQLKHIPSKVRPYIDPVVYKTGAWGAYINGNDVVLVEDLISTGTTLVKARDLLLRRYQPKSVSAITLLSAQ